MYETLGQLRISEMFDIVVDYPDSLPACRDTAECLRHTNLRRAFVTQFRRAVQQRLLHAGAATTGIIHQYVSSIRALRGVDPSGGWHGGRGGWHMCVAVQCCLWRT
jgi:anaphase-promoting complex subunit 2